MLDAITTEFTGAVAIIRFNQPVERNPLSTSTLQELKLILDRTIPRDDIRTIIFTGTEDVFASGAHIGELVKLDSLAAAGFSRKGQTIFQTIADAAQQTIAAINGYCMGGALDLALACDIRIASTHAIFSHPGARLGIITGWGGTQRLPRTIGRSSALELLLTAKRISATEALRIGLIQQLGDPVLEEALKIANFRMT